jgi:cutinase
VLGFRGQGQPSRGHRGVGREVDQVARALDAELGSAPLRLRRVRFPATAGSTAYDSDVATAVEAAGRAIRSACGRVVLVGYSQGAEVVHRVAVAHPRRVALAVLMGDPLRSQADRVATLTLGTGALAGRGNAGPGARFPDDVRRRVLEVCVRGDDVCNAPLTGRVGPPAAAHRTAYQDPAAARAIAARAGLLLAGS